MKTRFTRQELIDQVLDRHPLLKDSPDLIQTALGGTVQVGDDEYMEFGDWELMNEERRRVAKKYIGENNL
jgi:hypothetical protein